MSSNLPDVFLLSPVSMFNPSLLAAVTVMLGARSTCCELTASSSDLGDDTDASGRFDSNRSL
jgi:hypothetical protein